MPLESATYISDLNVANPAASDLVSQADDHIRMVKATLKNTFPNINAVCNATPLQLNQGFVPIGIIAMWSGSAAALPTGWKLCDGGTFARSDGAGNITAPDLRNKFIQGSGADNLNTAASPTIGTVGGVNSITPTITVDGTTLSQAHLPLYNLTVTDPGHNHAVTLTDPGHNHSYTTPAVGNNWGGASGWTQVDTNGVTSTSKTGISVANSPSNTGIVVSSGGGGAAHTHTASSSSFDPRPPFYTLAFIIKI